MLYYSCERELCLKQHFQLTPDCPTVWVTFLGFAVHRAAGNCRNSPLLQSTSSTPNRNTDNTDTKQPTPVSQQKFPQSQSNNTGTVLFGFQQVSLKYFKGGLQKETQPNSLPVLQACPPLTMLAPVDIYKIPLTDTNNNRNS